MLDQRVGEFIAAHADAVVVDLGAGLSDGYGRTRPTATVDWYNVDLPTIIALRNEVLPPRPREHNVVARIGDPDWAIRIPGDRPTILVADGLIGFLGETEMINLFRSITRHFRTGQLVFNDYGRSGTIGQTVMRLLPQNTSKLLTNAGFADPHQPEIWSPKLTLAEETSLAHAPGAERIPMHLRLALRIPAVARKWRLLRYAF